jgi:hypothetical protein
MLRRLKVFFYWELLGLTISVNAKCEWKGSQYHSRFRRYVCWWMGRRRSIDTGSITGATSKSKKKATPQDGWYHPTKVQLIQCLHQVSERLRFCRTAKNHRRRCVTSSVTKSAETLTVGMFCDVWAYDNAINISSVSGKIGEAVVQRPRRRKEGLKSALHPHQHRLPQ